MLFKKLRDMDTEAKALFHSGLFLALIVVCISFGNFINNIALGFLFLGLCMLFQLFLIIKTLGDK